MIWIPLIAVVGGSAPAGNKKKKSPPDLGGFSCGIASAPTTLHKARA